MASEVSSLPYIYVRAEPCTKPDCSEKHYIINCSFGNLHMKEGVRYLVEDLTKRRGRPDTWLALPQLNQDYRQDSYENSLGTVDSIMRGTVSISINPININKNMSEFVAIWKDSSNLPYEVFEIIMNYIKEDLYDQSYLYLLGKSEVESDLKQKKEIADLIKASV